MVRLTLFTSMVVGVVLLAGCQTMPWQRDTMPPVELLDDSSPAAQETLQAAPPPPQGLQMAPNQRFTDVPLPEKAKEDLERSYIYESQNLQMGRMVYTVRASVNDLAQFYIDACPAADWKLVNVKQASGGAEMLFQKSGKKLEVSITPLGIFRGKRLVIHLVPDSNRDSQF